MSHLLDTHVFLWWLGEEEQLAPSVTEILATPDTAIFVSAASVWEIAIKRALGKLEFEGEPDAEIRLSGFLELSISARHAVMAGDLPRHHDDPFDRVMVAQARAESLTLLSRDPAIARYDVPLILA